MRIATVRHPMKSKRVGVAQIAPVLGDTEANLSAHVAAVDRARSAKIDLLVFPELSLTGYRLKDSVPGIALSRSGRQIAELSKLSEEISFVVGLVEEDTRHNFYNSAFLFESGHVQAVHRKTYLPTYGMFDEQRYFARGRNLAAFHCKIGRAAILICEDMLHPTAVTVAALDGASTIIVPSASPVKGVTGVEEGEGGERIDANGRHWESYNRSMARTLGLYVVYANRVGVEDGIAFWGGSEIIDPAGETVAKAAYYEEGFIAGQISQEAVRRRRMQAPVLRDENVDLTINELSRLAGRERRDDRRRPGEHRPGEHRSRDRFPGGSRDRDRAAGPGRGRGGRPVRDERRPRGSGPREGRGVNIERGRMRDALAAADRKRRDGAAGKPAGGADKHEAVHAKRAVNVDMAVTEDSAQVSPESGAPESGAPESAETKATDRGTGKESA